MPPEPILAVAQEDILTLENLMPTMPNHIATLPDAVATMIVARELGCAPLSTFPDLMVINGTVGFTSKLMAALILRSGTNRYTIVEQSSKRAELIAYREYSDGWQEVGTFTFTWEDAVRAKLDEKETYKLYPADMLMNKAMARMARFAFPDVLRGYVPDEIEDITGHDFEEHAIHLGPAEDLMSAEEVAETLEAEIVE